MRPKTVHPFPPFTTVKANHLLLVRKEERRGKKRGGGEEKGTYFPEETALPLFIYVFV